jgi:all-trans-retinol dehydrogenase (NAD+)
MALKFAKRGANLTISDINEEGLTETKKMIKTQTGRDTNVLCIKLDVSNREAIKDSADQARNKFGNVDILINNAGIVQGKSILDLNEKLASKSLIVNMECHLWLIREFLPAMMDKNQGQIVSIASMAGVAGQPFMTDYCMSKFGAIGLSESVRIEMKRAGKNIVCTTIMPYFINTGMFDGVKCPGIFPFLDQKYTINRITNAILQNEEDVCISWTMGVIAHFSKTVFPASTNDLVLKLVLGFDAMADFKGRQEQNAIHKIGEKQ